MRRTLIIYASLLFALSLSLSSCGKISNLIDMSAARKTSTPSPPAGLISFDSNANEYGFWGIYAVNADGTGEPVLVTYHPKGEYWSTWSPDGRKIAFSSFRESGSENKTESIYISNADGTGLTRLTNNAAYDSMAAWSPTGREIAFSSNRDDGNFDIYIVRADGAGLIRFTDDPANESAPAWSPDGRWLTFDSDRSGHWEIYAIHRDGTGLTQYTSGSENGQSTWSPDGKKIAFMSKRDGNAEIYVMNADGSDALRITNDPSADIYPTWSPDGHYIAFSSTRSGNLDVYVMNADGSNVKQLTNDPADEYPPKWSPAEVTLSDKPWFGHPFCVLDADGDGVIDAATTTFPRGDEFYGVSFPYANVPDDLDWAINLVPETGEPVIVSEPWPGDRSGLMTYKIPSQRGFVLEAPLHGVGYGPYDAGTTIKVQLLIEDQIVQEIECEVVEP